MTESDAPPILKSFESTVLLNNSMYAKYAAEGDGTISRECAIKMFMEIAGETVGTSSDELTKMITSEFDRADWNGDGVLDKKEFVGFWAAIQGAARPSSRSHDLS